MAMRFYDTNGNELANKDDVDYSTGRYLQDENDPNKYVFSPWNSVPARPEEIPPNPNAITLNKLSSAIGDIEDALCELAEMLSE